MRKFSILHLSDLHITKVRNSYSVVLKKLIEDIAKETKEIDALILVVTGDVIDKANFEKAKGVAVSFFNDLNSKLNHKIRRIYFTPGNHDKKRVDCDQLLQSYFVGKKHEDLFEKFEINDWKNLFSHPFDQYTSLLNEISETLKIEMITDLFYCDVFEINDCYVRVNSINSSMTSFNDQDYGALHVGKFQIDKIERDFENKRAMISDHRIDVSLTIMHHPTFWLCKEEYDDIQYSISSNDSLATDVLLRGHTHNRSLENYYSLYNSFSTLVTGVGSSNKHGEHPQRYSIYTFMCDLNLIEIIMKASSEKGFIPDYSAYVSETDESRRKIHFPMRVHDFFSDIYLKLPLINKDFQPFYPSKQVIASMISLSEKLLILKEKLICIMRVAKQNLIQDLITGTNSAQDLALEKFLLKQEEVDSNPEELVYIEHILAIHSENVLKCVQGLLYEACFAITDAFFSDVLSEDEQVRVQFRVWNQKSSSHEGLTNHSLKGSEPIAECNITPVPWGNGLIRESSIKKIPLIYSLNKGYVKDRISETGWKDYFTYVPDIVPNMYFNSRTKVNYPILTFGINSNSKDCHLFFQTLSLMPLKMIIDDYLLDIHRSFNFAFDKLMKKNK